MWRHCDMFLFPGRWRTSAALSDICVLCTERRHLQRASTGSWWTGHEHRQLLPVGQPGNSRADTNGLSRQVQGKWISSTTVVTWRLSSVFVNTSRPRQNGRHFPDDTFKRIFMNENVRISINISLKFVPKGLINNILTLVQIMAWRRPGDKPLSEPMMVNLLTHICVTRPQWVKKMGAFPHSFIHWFGLFLKGALYGI